MIKQYVRRPVAVEALQVRLTTVEDIPKFVLLERIAVPELDGHGGMYVYLGHEIGTAHDGDYIVKSKKGLKVYSEKEFLELYEEVVADLIMEEEAEELENLKGG